MLLPRTEEEGDMGHTALIQRAIENLYALFLTKKMDEHWKGMITYLTLDRRK